MRLFVFKREVESHDGFTKRINDRVNLHREITIVDYNFGHDNDGGLQTVVAKWK